MTDRVGAFGRLLQQHRQAASLSQQELAERAGLSRRGISDLERGTRRAPYADTVRRLGEALQLTPPERAALLAASRRAAAGDSLAGHEPARLPAPLSSFVGREHEIDALHRLLGSTRLLTLAGPGGVGKTRLALAVAADVLDRFRDGVWFVDLAPLADPAEVPRAVAAALGVHERPGRPVLASLADALRTRHVLLVLDNCEHLAAACAGLVETLLGACPNLTMLTTSREVLRIAGETIWRVPPLGLPPITEALPLDEVARSEAVRLFVARAAAVQPGFGLTDQNLSTVADLCHRLDGLPLAIELAAARVRILSLEQLAALLGDRFRLLVRGSRTAAPRQQTLRATIEWSCGLLAEPERQLFERLAVFAGGWTLEAAEAVGAGDPIEPTDVLTLLTQLVDKSLVAAQQGLDGQARCRLLETLREYGWECLAQSDAADAAQRRHATFFLALAERAEPELRCADQAVWMWRLEQEHANLRAALQWTLERGEAELGLRLAGALRRFWWVRGYQTEGRRWLERLLAVDDGGSIEPATRAKALGVAGVLAYDQGDYGQAAALLDESLALCRSLGDDGGSAWTLYGLARVAGDQGDHGRAAALLEESLALFGGLGDQSGIAWALHELARGPLSRGDHGRAAGLHWESLALFRQVGDQGGIAWTLSHLGVGVSQRDSRAASALFEESLALFRDQGDERGIAWSLLQLGLVARDQGHTDRASALLAEALARYRDLGDRYGMAQLVGELGVVAGERGQPGRAARLCGAAQAMREDIGGRLLPRNQAPYDRGVAAARACLGDETFAAIWAVGQATPAEHAVAEALDVDDAPPSADLPGQRNPGEAPGHAARAHLAGVSTTTTRFRGGSS